MKFFHKTKNKIIGILLIAAIAITLILLTRETFTFASPKGVNGQFQFQWKDEVDLPDQVFGLLKINTIGTPILTDIFKNTIDYKENEFYSNTNGDELVMYLKDWSPTLVYEKENISGGLNNISIKENINNFFKNYSSTYYLVDDKSLDYGELWTKFMTYVDNRSKSETAFWDAYDLRISLSPNDPYVYGITSKYDGYDVSGRDAIAKKLNEYYIDYLTNEVQAKKYDDSKGIDLKGMKGKKYVNVIRTGLGSVDILYTEEIEEAKKTVGQCNSYVMFSVTNYEVNFKTPLSIPTVDAFNMDHLDPNGINSVYKDEHVTLRFSNDNNEAFNKSLKYYLTNEDYDIKDAIDLKKFNDVPENGYIGLYGNWFKEDTRYLYVRTVLNNKEQNKEYGDSDVIKYSFTFKGNEAEIDISLKPEEEYVDVGDIVTLENSNKKAVTFYTYDGTVPEFKVFFGDQNVSLDDLDLEIAQESNTIYVLESRKDYNYLKVNGFWYRYSKSMFRSDGPITVGSYIREQNRLLIRAVSVENECEFSVSQAVSRAYKMKQQVSAPVADVKTSDNSPAEIEMGSKINFSTTTAESEIFYTTNGSVPVIVTGADANGTIVTKPGNDVTKKYDARNSITITEEIASYGNNLTFALKAVCYDGIYRKMEDSEVVQLTYKIKQQKAVEPVSSIPATDDLSPVTVTPGDKIMLFSNTQGVTIYYTIDGSDPVIKKDGTLGKKTKKYNVSKGVTVPAQKKEALFILSAIGYADGYAASEISRLAYKYPDAIAPPYATPSGGVVSEYTTVELKTSTEGAIIYYELATGENKPKTPSTSSKVYDSENPIVITGQTTIKAIAVSNGLSSAASTFSYQVSSKLSPPTPSLQTGSIIASGTNLNLTADDGATIHYTIDGSDPSDSDNKNVNIGTTIMMEGDEGSTITVRACASKEGFSNSESASYSYSFSNYTQSLVADKESGTVVKNGDIVRLNTDVSNGVIYYTTDGNLPSTASNQGNTVVIQGAAGSSVTIKAIVITPGTVQTVAAASFTYTIMDKLAPPDSDVPTGATFTEESTINLSAPTGTIYYTTDGSQPTKGSSVFGGAITINRDMTIKAIAVSEDADTSEVSTFVYRFASQVEVPSISHENGEVDINTEITLDCPTDGSTIYYTTNGTDPNLDDKDSLNTYNGPIKVDRAMTLKVIAAKQGMRESKVLTVGYTVREQIESEEESSSTPVSVNNDSGRLMSRRTFSGENQGPSFQDIIIKNSTYGVMVASNFKVIPNDTKLNVNRSNVSESNQHMLRQQLDQYYDFVSNFEIGLEVEGVEIQPEGVIEIGIPIESEFENSIIYVVHVSEDGTVEVLDTRRSGGMAYAQVEHLSQYSIVAPHIQEEKKKNLLPIIIAGSGVAVVIIVFITIAVIQRRKYYDR